MSHIEISESFSTPRCPTSRPPNLFRRLDAPHRDLQIFFDASMPHIEISKSFSTPRRDGAEIVRPVTAKLAMPAEKLLNAVSYTHIDQLGGGKRRDRLNGGQQHHY